MSKRLLLIEDDNFFQKFYTTKLMENGYSIDVAANGKEGLQKLMTVQYDLIMLDLVMPTMDGFEVLKVRSKNEKIKKVPVIVFSTLGQEQDIVKAKELGANDYMNKTFYNFDELLKKIKTLAS